MRAKIKKVIVALNRSKEGARQVEAELREILETHGVKASWAAVERASVTASRPIPVKDEEMVIVGGGDGTLLQIARRLTSKKIPLLGINLGSLGFLTSIPQNEIQCVLPRILKGDYAISSRMTLKFTVKRRDAVIKKGWALNDVVATRGSHSHMIRLTLEINGECLTEYHCDGLVITTPTGSTAYSLSAGGPIMSPATTAFAITPICAHVLTNRPLVVDAKENVQLSVPMKGHAVVLQVDGVTALKLMSGDKLEFSASDEPALLAHLPESSFYSIARQKLKWSGASF